MSVSVENCLQHRIWLLSKASNLSKVRRWKPSPSLNFESMSNVTRDARISPNLARRSPVSAEQMQRESCLEKEPSPFSLGWQLCLQAILDGELVENAPGTEALANQSEAELLMRELMLVKSALAGNELKRPVPQTRQTYWHKIEQAIAGRE